MTLVSAPGEAPLLFPGEVGTLQGAGPPAANSVGGTISAAGHRFAYIIRCPKAATLNKFEFLAGAYSATNSPRVSFQSIDGTTGYPTGSVDQFRAITPTANSWNAPGLITSDGTNGGSLRVVARNDWLGCVIDFSAYTSGSLQIQCRNDTTQNTETYFGFFNGTSWSSTKQLIPAMALQYNDSTYAQCYSGWLWPIVSVSSGHNQFAFTSTSNPNEVGVKFQVPWKCVVTGVRVFITVVDNFNVTLYDSNTTTLATSTINKNMVGVTTSPGITHCQFDSAVTLSKNTTYRIGVAPQTANGNAVWEINANTTALMAAMPGGANWIETERQIPGAWTDHNTQQPYGMALQLSQIDDSTGPTGFQGIPFSRIKLGM